MIKGQIKKETMMQPNILRQRLADGKPTLGTRLHSSWPAVVEAVGHTGLFDYVEFLAEYAPYDAYALENFCRAADLHGMSAMIKLDYDSRLAVVQAVASGFHSVLFANVRSAADVQACVRLVRPETPEDQGEFGAVMGRFTYMEYGGGPAYVQALRELVIAVMVEKRQAVEALSAILAVPGVEMIQFGPADYAMSTGQYADRRSAEIRVVERQVIAACLQAGIQPRVELRTPDQAKEYLDLGVRHFNLGADLTILYTWLRQNGEALRNALEGK
jgi:4-hydroxy-2-oxoheptanedioate aldolase